MQNGAVVLGELNLEHALVAVVEFYLVQILEIVQERVLPVQFVAQFHHPLQFLGIDINHVVIESLLICSVKQNFGFEGVGGVFVGASYLRLVFRQHLSSFVEVLCYLVQNLFPGELAVVDGNIVSDLGILVEIGDAVEQALQFEEEICAKKLHFSDSDVPQRIIGLRHPFEYHHCGICPLKGTVEIEPLAVYMAVLWVDSGEYLHSMEVGAVGYAAATFVGYV